jgi:ABC-type lipoprotein export system ATPase subunit/ABC-type lipoprotein release transport system permease subunit
MISLQGLTKTYPSRREPVLKNLNLELPDTGLFFILGKSGSGKSTLLSLLGGMDFSYEGKIIVDSQDLKTMSEEEKAKYRFEKVSFVFQDYKAEEKETVKDNLLKALAITSLTEEEKEGRINRILKKLGLNDKLKSTFKTLSGGEKKRISLARALIRDAPILLVDEPLASLNEGLRKDLTKLFIDESHKRLVIVITHAVDDIPPYSNVYSLVNGELICQNKAISENNNKPLKAQYIRKKYQGRSLIHSLFSLIGSQRRFLILTFFTLAMALFSITFSFLLSGGVNASIKNSLLAYMDDDSLVVEKRDQSYTSSGFESADYGHLSYLANRYLETVLDVTPVYFSSLDDIFGNNQAFYLTSYTSRLELSKLSLDLFLEANSKGEIELPSELVNYDLQEEEIILGLEENDLKNVYFLVCNERKTFLDSDDLSFLNSQLRKKSQSLVMIANQNEWSYALTHSLILKGVFPASETLVYHPNSFFSDYFVQDILHFKTILEEEDIDPRVPWTLKRGLGLKLNPYKEADFLKDFLSDETNDPYTLKPCTDQRHYKRNDPLSHNRVIVYKDYLPKVSLSDIKRFTDKNADAILNISYSSPIYTYTASGYISGFCKPFFLSRYKDRLNTIEDNYYESEENLGSFQGSLITPPKGVIKADLLSAIDNNGLSFASLENKTLLAGKKPASFQEIVVSSGLAKSFFSSSEAALGENLSTLMLERTVQDQGIFHNIFAEGTLKISGIYEEDRNVIYQDNLFPLAYAFSLASLEPNEIRITEAVLEVDWTKHDSSFYLEEVAALGDYLGSFPMLVMTNEIKETLSNLSLLFLFFACLSLLSSAFLLGLSLFLIIRKQRKEIGILLSLGYEKKEIVCFFLKFSFLIGIISYLLSIFISVLTELALKETLIDLFSQYQFSLVPYLISFLTALILTLSVGAILSLSIRKIEPSDSFLKD